MKANVEIAVIGGTGICPQGMLKNEEKLALDTPYGKPSSDVVVGEYKGARVAFLFRHGYPRHVIPPHRINFRANIWALKELGVQSIIGTAAVGSLKDYMHPGEVVLADQFIDFGKDTTTFYDGPEVVHVSVADPFCPELRGMLIEAARKLEIKHHEKGIYLRVEGPRFSTRAESKMFRHFADVIGMTCIPEAILAREQGICYAVIAMITDYDVYKDRAVEAHDVIETMKNNAEKTEAILKEVLGIHRQRSCSCHEAPEKGRF